jgi:sigma-B regulation protein RsbU (phosphoserine phosphatase)
VALHYHAAGTPTGAFYDFLRLADGCWGVLVGDLSPHGVEPGVLMGLARKVLRIRMRESADLATALGRANDDLCEELEQESYVTALAVSIDGPGRRIRWARAGHAAPFLFRAGRETVERLETPGPLLGLVPTATFEEPIASGERALEAGDALLLHGEGVEGVRNLAGEAFGGDRIAAFLSGQGGKPAPTALLALLGEVTRFRGPAPQERDATAILLRFP